MTSIELRIQSIYDSLSNAEKKVADYFMNNIENVFNKPIAQLAQEAGVSKVAWVRFCKDIGFDGLKDLKKALFGELSGELTNPADQPMEVLVPGEAEGILCGGNLSLLAASLGTPWEVDTKGKILFLEDIGEKTYRVDGMLTQLRNAGKFEDCAGIILGAWTDCPPEYPEKTLLLPEIFQQLIVPAGKPTISDVACGHVLPTLSLPLGRVCTLNADSCTITLE